MYRQRTFPWAVQWSTPYPEDRIAVHFFGFWGAGYAKQAVAVYDGSPAPIKEIINEISPSLLNVDCIAKRIPF